MLRIWLNMGLSLVVISLTCCALERQLEPELLKVCQVDSDPCAAYAFAGESVDVVFLGNHFHRSYSVDLGNKDQPQSVGDFKALIAGQSLLNVELVEGDDESRLHATLVDSLPLGVHPAQIETPSGQQAALGAAFELLNPINLQVLIQKNKLPLRDSNQLRIQVENQSSTSLEQVRVTIIQSGVNGVYSLPESQPSVTLQAKQTYLTEAPLVAQAVGANEISVAVQALSGQVVLESTPVSVFSTILEQARLLLQAAVDVDNPKQGERVAIDLQVTNQGQVAVLDLNGVILSQEGTGAIEFDPIQSANRVLAPNAQTSFRFTGNAIQPGTVSLYLGVTATEQISDREVSATSQEIQLAIGD